MEQSDHIDDESSDHTTLSLKKTPDCQVEGCTTDLTTETAYCIKRHLCKQHMKADAVSCKGQAGLWRFCFQCGKLEPLSKFEGDKRSCRTRLAQRKQRETSRCHSDFTYRHNRSNKQLTPLRLHSRYKPLRKPTQKAAQLRSLVQDVQEELHLPLQWHQQEPQQLDQLSHAAADETQYDQLCQQQQQQYSSPLHVIASASGCSPGPRSDPLSRSAGIAPAAAGASQCTVAATVTAAEDMEKAQYSCPLPARVLGGASIIDVYGEWHTKDDLLCSRHDQHHHQQQQQHQQVLAAAITAHQAARRVSFAPAAAAATESAGVHGNHLQRLIQGGSNSGTGLAPHHRGLHSQHAGCRSAPLPTRSCLSGPSAWADTSPAAAPALTSPASVANPEAHLAAAAVCGTADRYYSQLLDDLMLEVRSVASAGPAAAAHDIKLADPTVGDPLQQHTDDDIRQMLETALMHAAAPPPAQQQQQQQQLQRQRHVTAALAVQTDYQQQQQHLQLPTPQQQQHWAVVGGTASTAAASGGGFSTHEAAAVLPQPAQQHMLSSSRHQLLQLQQQKNMLLQLQTQAAIMQTGAHSGAVARSQIRPTDVTRLIPGGDFRTNMLSAIKAEQKVPHIKGEQLNDMQEILNFLQIEMIDHLT